MVRSNPFLILVSGFLFFSFTPSSAENKTEPPAKYLIYISLDAFNPQWYQNKKWAMPFLQKKAREGAYARKVRPPFPSTTRPGHVTLITGLLPAKHGVYNNDKPYHLEGKTTLFHGVNKTGGETASVIWVGATPDLVDYSLQSLDFVDFSEADSRPPLKKLNKDGGTSSKFKRYITGTLRDAQLASVAVSFIEDYQPNFLALRFNDTDKMQHYFGREATAVRGKVASVDMALAEVAAAVKRAGIADETIFIVSGDHGMDDIHTILSPNVWLDKAGLGSKDGTYFEAYGGSAFLHNADEAKAEEIRKMLQNLPEYVRQSFKILSKKKLDEIGADPRAVFALTAAEGYRFDGRWKKPAQRSTDLHGTHGGLATPETPNNYTGFVIWGPGIKPGTVIDEMGLEDVAPTAAELLGVDIGRTDGKSRVPQLIKNQD